MKLQSLSKSFQATRWLSFTVTVWLVIGTACSVTGIWQPTAAPVMTTPTTAAQPATRVLPTSTQQPAPTQVKATSVPLPPSLVESAPLPSSELGLKQPVILYFNQAMEKSSVEGAFQAQPAVAGSFKWLNAYAVSFTPDKPLPANTELVYQVSTKARAANGLPLSAPVELRYRTGVGLKEIDLLPKPGAVDVDPASAVVATFNQPVVPLGAEPANLVPAFTLEPETRGRGEWLNTSTFIFYPDPPLMGGKEYTVRFKADLTATDGAGWVSEHVQSWTFTTELPKVIVQNPSGRESIGLDEAFTLHFNQIMDRASVERGLTLKANSESVAGKFTWDEKGTQVQFTPSQLLVRNTKYTLRVSGEARSAGGAALGKDYSVNYFTVPTLGMRVIEPANGAQLRLYDVQGMVRLRITAPLADQDLLKLIQISPQVENLNIDNRDIYELHLSGIFKPSTQYKVTVSAGLKDRWGAPLGSPYQLEFSTEPAQPALSLVLNQPYADVLFITPSDTTLQAQAAQIKTVQLAMGKLTLEEFFRLETISPYEREAQQPAGLARWEKKFSLPANQSTFVSLPFNPTGSSLAPGVYYFAATSPELGSKNQRVLPTLVLCSRVHLMMKTGPRQVTLWLVNLDTQQVIPGIAVEVFRSAGKGRLASLGTTITNTQGIAQMEIVPQADDAALVAVVGKPGDANFGMVYSNWSENLLGWDFEIPTDYSADGLDTYMYTDRAIYRAEQVVHFRGMVNQKENGRYGAATLKQVNVKLMGDFPQTGGEQPELGRLTLPVSAYGTFNGQFDLPVGAQPGWYRIVVEQDDFDFSIEFQVAEYRKPEVDISIRFARGEIKLGEDLTAMVNAQYFFGAPAGNMDIQWTLTVKKNFWYLPGGFQSGDWDADWLTPGGFGVPEFLLMNWKEVASGKGKSAADGTLSITVPAAVLKAKAASIQRQELILEVTVADTAENRVSARESAVLHPDEFYIGIKPDVWSGQAKKPLGFLVQTMDWKGSASGSRSLKGTFQKVTWKVKENWQPGMASLFETIYTPVGSADLKTDAQGRARLEFTPPEAGTYQLEIRGGDAVSRVLTWVGGEGRAPWLQLPAKQLELALDAEEYSPGQKAKIFIPNPLGEKTLALITMERSKVMMADVVVINGNQLEYELPVRGEDAPNVIISVTLLGRTGTFPDFRQGYKVMYVKPDALRLQLDVKIEPERAQPGAETRIKLSVKDAQGKPVQGEFSAALVDKAVLALADANAVDIFSAFYGTQPLAVQSSMALSLYARKMENEITRPMLGAGGGGGADGSVEDLRSQFEDTAYWNGGFETDAQGNAELVMRLPDNLTTWVITVRGVSHDRKVGEAVRELVTSKDLLLRPFTPRFLVAGDRVELAAVVHNDTGTPMSAEVSLQASGVALEEPARQTQKVDLPSGERRRVTWWVKVGEGDAADLRFTVRGGGLQDASTAEWGKLPIYQYTAAQTFATAGVLAEAGERLEVVSIPRSFTPNGGQLSIEMTPSLAAVILNGLKAMEKYPFEHTEAILSRLFPNLRTYQILLNLGMESEELKNRLEEELRDALAQIVALQNGDGGWGWNANKPSHPYLSAYALLALSEAKNAGLFVDAKPVTRVQDYLAKHLIVPKNSTPTSELERSVFILYSLNVSGKTQASVATLYPFRERFSAWARAMLALTLHAQDPKDERARTLLSDLQTKAVRSATGAFWNPAEMDAENLTTPNFSTAIVVLALAKLDPAAALLPDAVRYLVAHRQPCGCWSSSYEAAWVLAALGETLKASGDVRANFIYSASLNGAPLASGQAAGNLSALSTAKAVVPLSRMSLDTPNALIFKHEAGSGKLYFRAVLHMNRPVETAQPLQAGVSLARRYVPGGENCRKTPCKPIESISLSQVGVVQVRLTVTIPKPMYYLVLEDYIPAGMEIVNTNLNTARRVDVTFEPQEGQTPKVDPADPFGGGWNGWVFGSPRIYAERISWMAPYVPAGTYEVTYRLTPLLVGEYRVLPARAYQNYFPEVQGTSGGAIFKVLP